MTGFVAEQLSQRAGAVRHELSRVAFSPDEEAVHDLRVSIRRLIESSRSLRDYLKPRPRRELRARLRPLMKAAGAARTLDVALALCAKSALPHCAETVAPLLQAGRAAAAQRLVETLLTISPDQIAVPTRRESELLTAPALAASILPPMVARYWEAGEEAVARHADWEGLHRFRLVTKHLRYTLELLAPAYGARGMAARLAVLREVQGHLGRINDCQTTRGLDAVRSHASLSSWLEDRQHSERNKFLEAWGRYAHHGEAARLWLRYFSRPLAREPRELVK